MITKPSRIVIKSQRFDTPVTRLRITTGSFLTVSDTERDDQTLDIYPSVHLYRLYLTAAAMICRLLVRRSFRYFTVYKRQI